MTNNERLGFVEEASNHKLIPCGNGCRGDLRQVDLYADKTNYVQTGIYCEAGLEYWLDLGYATQ